MGHPLDQEARRGGDTGLHSRLGRQQGLTLSPSYTDLRELRPQALLPCPPVPPLKAAVPVWGSANLAGAQPASAMDTPALPCACSLGLLLQTQDPSPGPSPHRKGLLSTLLAVYTGWTLDAVAGPPSTPDCQT